MTTSTDDSTQSRSNFQYSAFGVLVRNVRITAVHVANGMVQLLRLINIDEIEAAPTEDPLGAHKDLMGEVKHAFPGNAYGLSPAARALCIISTKRGPFRLDVPGSEVDSRALPIHEAGRRHLEHLGLDPSRLTRHVHAGIAGALNADQRVMVAGSEAPSTPGRVLAGLDSNYTLSLMHAPTFLGLLCAGPEGRERLKRLADLVLDASDPHSALVRRLDLEQINPDPHLTSLPVPAGARWERQAATVASAVGKLLRWSEERTAQVPKAEVLSSLVDLSGLIFTSGMMRWKPGHQTSCPSAKGAREDAWAPALVVAAPRENGRDSRRAVAAARRSMQVAQARLNSSVPNAKTHMWRKGKREPAEWYRPSTAALALGAATGWLLPRDARGGARRFVSPHPRQLTTLVRSLIEFDEDVPWAELHRRAEAHYGLCLGGWNEYNVARELGGVVPHTDLIACGRVNQEHLIALGLARRESDNVVRVNGGAW